MRDLVSIRLSPYFLRSWLNVQIWVIPEDYKQILIQNFSMLGYGIFMNCLKDKTILFKHTHRTWTIREDTSLNSDDIWIFKRNR
jgi:hypothetical protein